jgi:hypothetical protein
MLEMIGIIFIILFILSYIICGIIFATLYWFRISRTYFELVKTCENYSPPLIRYTKWTKVNEFLFVCCVFLLGFFAFPLYTDSLKEYNNIINNLKNDEYEYNELMKEIKEAEQNTSVGN